VVEQPLAAGAPALAGVAEVYFDTPGSVAPVVALHGGAVGWRVGEYVER
jgi:hypothetical protein